jgi:hypothetical protein
MPDQPADPDPIEGFTHDGVDKYKSIGQFYEELEKGRFPPFSQGFSIIHL